MEELENMEELEAIDHLATMTSTEIDELAAINEFLGVN